MTLRIVTGVDRMKKRQEKIEAIELDWRGRVKKRTARGRRRRAEREAKRAKELASRANRLEQFRKCVAYREELDFE